MLLFNWHLWYISTELLELLHHWHHRHHRHHLRNIWNLWGYLRLLLDLLVLWSCCLLRFRLLRFLRSRGLLSTMLFFMMLVLLMFVFTFIVRRFCVIFNINCMSLHNLLNRGNNFLDNFRNFLNDILCDFWRSSCDSSLFNLFFFWFVHNFSRFLFFTRLLSLVFLPLRLLNLGFNNSVLLYNYLFNLYIFCYNYWFILSNLKSRLTILGDLSLSFLLSFLFSSSCLSCGFFFLILSFIFINYSQAFSTFSFLKFALFLIRFAGFLFFLIESFASSLLNLILFGLGLFPFEILNAFIFVFSLVPLYKCGNFCFVKLWLNTDSDDFIILNSSINLLILILQISNRCF